MESSTAPPGSWHLGRSLDSRSPATIERQASTPTGKRSVARRTSRRFRDPPVDLSRVGPVIGCRFRVHDHPDRVGRLLHALTLEPPGSDNVGPSNATRKPFATGSATPGRPSRKALLPKSWLVFLDESGVLGLRWCAGGGRCGAKHCRCHSGAHHRKVSVLAALCVGPPPRFASVLFSAPSQHRHPRLSG